MQHYQERRIRRKLLFATVTLSAVFVIAAVAQRDPRILEPFATKHTVVPVSGQRAVFGAPPTPVVTPATEVVVPPPPPAPAQGTERSRVVEPEPVPQVNREVPAEILGFVEQWRKTMSEGTLNAHLDAYAPKVSRFFTWRNVSRDAVRREKERMFRIYPNVNRYDISNVELESLKGDRAAVTFKKDWDMSGVRRFAGSEKQRLTLQKAGGSWQIVGEEELKVYWLRK